VPGADRRRRLAAADPPARRESGDPRLAWHAHRLLRHAVHADGRQLQYRAGGAAGTAEPERRDPRAMENRRGIARRESGSDVFPGVSVLIPAPAIALAAACDPRLARLLGNCGGCAWLTAGRLVPGQGT